MRRLLWRLPFILAVFISFTYAAPQIGVYPSPVSGVKGSYVEFNVGISDSAGISSYFVKIEHGSYSYIDVEYPYCVALDQNATHVFLSCSYYIEPGESYSFAQVYVWAKNTQGDYGGKFVALDVSGVQDPPEEPPSVDEDAPDTTIAITSEVVSGATMMFEVNISDQSEIEHYLVEIQYGSDGYVGKDHPECNAAGGTNDVHLSCVYYIDPNKDYTYARIYVWAKDTRGNYSGMYKPFEVAEDTTPPSVSITSPEEGSTFTTPEVNVAFTASDDNALSLITIDCNSDGTPEETIEHPSNPYSGTYTCTYSSPGNYTITITAKDPAGNTGSSSVNIEIVSDTTPPTITSFTVSPTSGDTSTTFTISCSAQDNESGIASIEIYVDNEQEKTCSSSPCSYESTFPVGEHNTYCKAIDNAKNESRSETLLFTVVNPNEPPTCSISISPSSPTTGDNVAATVHASDDRGLSSAKVYLDGVYKRSCSLSGTSDSCTVYLGMLSEGWHTVSARVYDTDGATGRCSRRFRVNAPPSNEPPVVKIVRPEDGEEYVLEGNTVNVLVEWSAYDPDGSIVHQFVRCSDPGVDVSVPPEENTHVCTYHYPGEYKITVRVFDDDGASAIDSVHVRVVSMDTTPPSVSITSPEEGSTFTTPDVNVAFTASDDNALSLITIDCNSDGTPEETIEHPSNPYSGTYTCTYSSPGNYTITVTAKDPADNTGSSSVNISLESNVEENVTAVLSAPEIVEENTPFFVHVYAYASAGLDTVLVYRNEEEILSYTDGGNELNVSLEQALQTGTYVYRLVVSDVEGHTAEDNVTVVVTSPEANVHVYQLVLTPFSGTVARVLVEGLEDGEYADVACTDITYSVEALDKGVSSHECREIWADDHKAAEIVITGVGRYRVTVVWRGITETVSVVVLRTVSAAGVPPLIAGIIALFFFLLFSRWFA